MPEKQFQFENAFTRLEEILEQMNDTEVSLDDSLKLYEEADQLIHSCSTRLNQAEQKVEALIKERNGSLSLDQEGKVQTEPFEEA